MNVAARTLLALFPLLAACTSVTVRPVSSATPLQHVCIVKNPKVTVSDFVPVLQDGFDRHQIATAVVDESQAGTCGVTLTYTALRSWDFKPYLSHAELRLWRAGRQIASARTDQLQKENCVRSANTSRSWPISTPGGGVLGGAPNG